MCGKFNFSASVETLRERFDWRSFPVLAPCYNIAPTQDVVAVRVEANGQSRKAVSLRWGLIPSWADSPSMSDRMINARVETVASKPAYRSAFRQRRCLIPADGFFEWQKQNGQKQPFLFRLRDGRPFAFAGLWERWQQGAQLSESCTILTTEANEVVRPLHDRLPVILPAHQYHVWLDCPVQRQKLLLPLLGAYPAEEMIACPVSMRVNSPRNDDLECVRSLA